MIKGREILIGAIGGIIVAGLIIGWVFATGQTFGQRCAAHYDTRSTEWSRCVNRLGAGLPDEEAPHD